MRKSYIGVGLVLCSVAGTPVLSGDFGNAALTQTPITTVEIMRSYEGNYDLPGTERGLDKVQAREAISKIRRICRSSQKRDQFRCGQALTELRAGYELLQARKASEFYDD